MREPDGLPIPLLRFKIQPGRGCGLLAVEVQISGSREVYFPELISWSRF